MMTMTMSSPQCRNHGLSGACSHLALERQPLCGLARKQTHQSGCLLYLFRHAFMNEGLAALHAQSQSFSPSRKPNSSPRRKGLGRIGFAAKLTHSLSSPQPWPCRGSLRAVCRHTPGDVIILPPAATCYTMEVSTIPGESHPGLGSAGSINAVPSAGRARHSHGLVIPAHKPHEPPWLPRYAKSQTCIPWRIRPPGIMLAASLDEPH